MDEFQKELQHAIFARSNGNEGMARVCSRRAAGIVIGQYLLKHGYSNLSQSVYKRISIFYNLNDTDPKLKIIASHFLLQVNKEHQLPDGIDLLADVQILENDLIQSLHY